MRGLGIACRPSACLSFCPSVTLVDCESDHMLQILEKKVKTSIYIARFMHQAPLTRNVSQTAI